MNWLFRNRRTGEITVAQAPNAPLVIWLAATVVNALFDPTGRFGSVLTVTATVALVIWALDELARGVNPFRRILGAVILALQLGALVRR